MHMLSKDIYIVLFATIASAELKNLFSDFYLNGASVASYHKDKSRLPKLLS